MKETQSSVSNKDKSGKLIGKKERKNSTTTFKLQSCVIIFIIYDVASLF